MGAERKGGGNSAHEPGAETRRGQAGKGHGEISAPGAHVRVDFPPPCRDNPNEPMFRLSA